MKPSQATQLVDLGLGAVVELFHDDQVAYASFPVGGHLETWPLRSKGFKNWLAHRYHDEYSSAANAQSVQDALSTLEGQALFACQEHPVSVRLAEVDGAIYLDLANDRWEVVCISAAGWEVKPVSAVRFRRVRGMQALPQPAARAGVNAVDLLRHLLNVEPKDFPLLLAYIIAALRPTGPYPVLMLHGEQGAAKSTTLRVIRELVDPNVAAVRAEPRDGHDLMIAATNGWLVALDNVSRLPDWLSDALCRLSTGGGFATRELYSDREETLFDAMRPVMVNSIEELAMRGDLLDRAIVLYLPTIADHDRQAEDEFWHHFVEARPVILAALLDVTVTAIRNLPGVQLARKPRMADFAKWIVAAQPAIPNHRGDPTMLEAYLDNRKSAHDLVLSGSPLVPYLKMLPAQWEGSAGDLLAVLNTKADEATRRSKTWPDSPRGLSNALRRLVPNLRASGMAVAFSRSSGKGSRRLIEIRQVGPDTVAIDATVANEPGGDARDAGDGEIPTFLNGDPDGQLFDEAYFADLAAVGAPVEEELE